MSVVISVENISKNYRLGQIGTGTFSRDLEVWWAKMRGKPNPLLRIGEKDHGDRDDEELWALRDVSFKVEQGEVLGIIGRNGAGKSTLLKILSRVTAPTTGKIKVKGRIASLLEVGTGFHPELTGRENIYLNGAILGMSRKEINLKFDEIVNFAEVEKFIDTPVKRYSSGMYVRLAFAVAAHLDPEILVVDEVLAVGDSEFQKKCLGKMGDVAKEGRTVLLVSHNLAQISNLSHNVIQLDNGRLVDAGNPDVVISNYHQRNTDNNSSMYKYTGELSGESKCKIIQVRLFRNDRLPNNEFPMADQLIIETQIWAPLQIGNMQFGFDLTTISGIRVAVGATWIKKYNLELNPGLNTLEVKINSIRVAPGEYFLSFGLYKLPGDHHHFLSNCLIFSVIEKDIFQTGYLPTGNSQGLTWFEYEFYYNNLMTMESK